MTLWKTYFWFAIAINLVGYAVEVSVRVFGLFPSIQADFSEPYKVIELLEAASSLISLIAVFGYTYKRSIFNATIWKVVFAFNFSIIISVYISLYKPLLLEFGVSFLSLGALALILLFTVPGVIGNYLYAFKSNHIWSNKIA